MSDGCTDGWAARFKQIFQNKDNPLGYCPVCGAPGQTRERRMNGDDKCKNGHTYPSAKSKVRSPEKRC